MLMKETLRIDIKDESTNITYQVNPFIICVIRFRNVSSRNRKLQYIVVKVHRSYHTTSLVNQSFFIRISYKNRKEKKIISLVLACEEEDQRTLSENPSGKTNFMFK